MRLLLVEDDLRAATYLAKGLTESGHIVDTTEDGETGLVLALEGIFDALIVDRFLPNLNGLDLVRKLRERDTLTPVLMMSAIASMKDKVDGMRAGCDDYVAKPYAFIEVLARLDALARRSGRVRRQTFLTVRDLQLDTQSRKALRNGCIIQLQNREFLILEYLMRHADQIVTRSMLLEAVWQYDFEPRGNVVDMHVHRLRQKISQGCEAPLIQTVVHVGYIIRSGEPA